MTLAAALVADLDDAALRSLAERLRPYLVPDEDQLLTPAEAAARLSLHPKTLTRAAAAGRVPGAMRIGRAWRFRPSELALEPPAGVRPTPTRLPQRSTTGRTATDAIRTGAKEV